VKRLVCTVVKLARRVGPRWLFFRLLYAVQLKMGLLRLRIPPRPWRSQLLPAWVRRGVPSEPADYFAWRKDHPRPFFFQGIDERLASIISLRSGPVAEADAVLAGRWTYFEHLTLDRGFPPDWHLNPLSGQRAPVNRHWSQIGDFDHGDIKLIWEPSRFSVAYTLVRAYAFTRDERYAAAFWTLVEDWAKHNPPQLGVNWKCGQEAAFRSMAWCFALYAFASSSQTTPPRIASLAAMLAIHAHRIEANIAYALSQGNNHSISEATGLWTVGLLFPEFRRAERWRRVGKKVLENEATRQIYQDGSYVQHSFNYHRLMLQDYLWALRLGELCGQLLSREVYDRVGSAVKFLCQHCDPVTGQVPNYGGNDGTLVLPLNGCDYTDFRPVIQACHYLLRGEHFFPSGPWDEDLLWLFGPEAALRSSGGGRQISAQRETDRIGEPLHEAVFPRPQGALCASGGGYSILRGRRSWAMIRCAPYRSRPSHADQLHFDLWWRGINLACDAGTYLYNGPLPWMNALASTTVHNTVTLDGREQMARVGRFLWLDWAQGTVWHHLHSHQGLLELWEGEHDGYCKQGATHRRAVVRSGDDTWLVVDDVVGAGEHVACLHWLLPDLLYELRKDKRQLLLHSPAGPFVVELWCNQPAVLSLARAGEELSPQCGCHISKEGEKAVRGWRSRYYADKEPALSLALESRATLPVRFITLLASLSAGLKQLDEQHFNLETERGTLTVCFSPPGTRPIIQQACSDQADHEERLAPSRQPDASAPQHGIHVLLIHQMFAPPAQAGGTRHYELASRLVRQGFHFTIVASDTDYLTGRSTVESRGLVKEENLDGMRVLRAYTYPALHRSFVWRVVSFLSFAATSLWATFRVGSVDVVMGTTPSLFQAVSAWLVAMARRRPFLLEVRDLWPEFAIDIGVLKNRVLIVLSRWLERFLYSRATHLVVNSPAYREYLLSKQVPAEKITVIPNGVDPAMFDPAADGWAVREQFGLGGKFVVTYAGAMGLANDLETLLRAAHRLRDDPAIHLLLVGDGKERPHLEAQAQALRLSNVTFAGAQPKCRMPDFLAASDACVATLKNIRMFRTTYPNKVFDYMAAGRPTILGIDGVIRQVVEAAGGGIFVPPGDDAALAEAVRTLSRDPQRARAMGAAARAYVAKHFHRQQQAEQLAALVTRLVGT